MNLSRKQREQLALNLVLTSPVLAFLGVMTFFAPEHGPPPTASALSARVIGSGLLVLAVFMWRWQRRIRKQLASEPPAPARPEPSHLTDAQIVDVKKRARRLVWIGRVALVLSLMVLLGGYYLRTRYGVRWKADWPIMLVFVVLAFISVCCSAAAKSKGTSP